MKFLATLVAAAAAVSASPVASAAAKDPVFDITDFNAGCIPHSSQCRYAFHVVQSNAGETKPVHCVALVTSNGDLPNVKNAECDNSSRTFSVVRSKSGLKFSVSQPITPSSNQSGSHFILNKELVTSNQPNAVVQSYKGPTKFSLY